MAEQQNVPAVPFGDRTTTDIITDGVCQVHLINGLIKMDLLQICPNGTDKPNMFIDKRLVMSLNQFLASVNVMNNMVDELIKKGVVSKQD